MSETIVPTVYGTLGMALFTIAFGIFVEKYYVGRWSIIFNCINVVFLVVSLNLSQILEMILLIIYAIMGGLLVFYKGHKRKEGRRQGDAIQVVAHLFGSKAFGSLSLAIALDGIIQPIFSTQLLTYFKAQSLAFQIFDYIPVVFSWLFLSVIVFFMAGIVLLYSYFRSKK